MRYCSRVENGEQPQRIVKVINTKRIVAEWRTGNNRNVLLPLALVGFIVAEWRTGNNRNYYADIARRRIIVAEWRTGNNRN